MLLRQVKKLVDQGFSLHYTIVGDGPEAERLQTLTAELGLTEIITFEGAKPHNEVWA